jgi:hypothetical protein
VFSRVVVGRWFVSSDFFVPENKALGLPMAAAGEIVWGVTELSGRLIVGAAVAGALLLILFGVAARGRARYLIPVALCATAAVPWSAFLDGHPFRIRYMIPLIAFEAVAAGALAGLTGGLLRRGHPLGRGADVALAALLAGVAAFTLRPLDTSAPMVVEAQWDRPNAPVRHAVTTACARYDGTTVMASMGSSGTTCRRRRTTGSTSAIFCTKETAISGWRRSRVRGLTQAGC